ncbi:recombinase family protein [Azotobacter vinelandii]
MTENGAKVYSYLRFSDPRQAQGHSADRQTQYARNWAAQRGLQLDESLSLRDEGLSAYHQRHVKQGALGAFLRAVDGGKILPGSVLVVEGLDRLSRAEPIQAQAQLAQIINAGITVVTASDGREYNREGLKAQPMDLVYSLLVMIRAHEESDTKSKRVKAAIRRQCEGWQAGTYRGMIRNGKDPQWLRWTGAEWELIPERVEAVRHALELYRRGLGAKRAFRIMHERGHSLTDLGVSSQQIYRLVKLPALRGAKRISIDGESYMLEDYYPRLLSDSEFAALQALVGQRFRRRGRGVIPAIITGMRITICGYCGAAITSQNLMQRMRQDGTMSDGYRRMICTAHSANAGCPGGGSCSSAPIERAILNYCSDQINLQRLHEPAIDGQPLQERVAVARRRVQEVEQQLARVTEALLLANDGTTPLAFVRKARELEEQLEQRQADLLLAERELAAQASSHTPATADRWAQLAAAADAMDIDARDEVRQLVMDTFERIVVYMRGLIPVHGGGEHIDLVLISRAGQRRWLRIERRTGKWSAGADHT